MNIWELPSHSRPLVSVEEIGSYPLPPCLMSSWSDRRGDDHDTVVTLIRRRHQNANAGTTGVVIPGCGLVRIPRSSRRKVRTQGRHVRVDSHGAIAIELCPGALIPESSTYAHAVQGNLSRLNMSSSIN